LYIIKFIFKGLRGVVGKGLSIF